jgi:hypothetical protein
MIAIRSPRHVYIIIIKHDDDKIKRIMTIFSVFSDRRRDSGGEERPEGEPL